MDFRVILRSHPGNHFAVEVRLLFPRGQGVDVLTIKDLGRWESLEKEAMKKLSKG